VTSRYGDRVSRIAIAALLLTAAACGGSEREAAAPPPIAAAKPAESAAATPEPAAARRAAPDGGTLPPGSEASTSAPGAPAKKPAAEPAYTPGTSLPGAIPPAPLPDPSAKPAEAPPDALQWLQDSEARKADHQRRLLEAQESVDAARADVVRWQDILLAFKNPFRPRPQLAAEEAAAIEGMDGAARAHWAEGRLAGANAALEAANKKLEQIKANPPLN